jgi:hypothetical protein
VFFGSITYAAFFLCNVAHLLFFWEVNNSLATKIAKALSILSSYVINPYRMSYFGKTFVNDVFIPYPHYWCFSVLYPWWGPR